MNSNAMALSASSSLTAARNGLLRRSSVRCHPAADVSHADTQNDSGGDAPNRRPDRPDDRQPPIVESAIDAWPHIGRFGRHLPLPEDVAERTMLLERRPARRTQCEVLLDRSALVLGQFARGQLDQGCHTYMTHCPTSMFERISRANPAVVRRF